MSKDRSCSVPPSRDSLPSFGFLAGLPRTGSTLLTCILGQNPDVFVSGSSPIARLMLGAHLTCTDLASEGLIRVRRTEFRETLLTEIPRLYYKDTKRRFVVEKDRAWGHDPLGFAEYLSDDPRIVVLLRSVPEIIRSFVAVKVRNKDVLPERDLLVDGVDPFVDAFRDTLHALTSGDDRYLFGTYDQLVLNPSVFVDAIYRHYRWPRFQHDYETVVDLNLEDDDAERTPGLHEVRAIIARRQVNVIVSESLMAKAQEYDRLLWAAVSDSLRETPHRHI